MRAPDPQLPHSSHSLAHLFHRGLLLLVTLTLSVNTLVAQDDNDPLALEFGKPMERELGVGQVHSYTITLTAGQYIHATVKQRGIDVIITLFDRR